MNTIVIATRNPGKFEEFVKLLQGCPLKMISLEEFPEIEILEDGNTFDENAIKKAEAVAQQTGFLALGDDSGLQVLALGGKPGIHTARYAGDRASDNDNIQKLLWDMKDVHWEHRQARFVCSLALGFPGGEVVVEHGFLEGFIDVKPKGSQGFGYDPIFFVPELGVTLAEVGREEKNRMSHRAKALEGIKRHLPRGNWEDRR